MFCPFRSDYSGNPVVNITERLFMKKFRRFLLWLGLFFIVLLTLLSVYGAFVGAESAGRFFNSIPLAVYWSVFAVMLLVSIFVFPRLLKVPSLLMMHLGCVLIIAGSMWGSQAGHQMQKKLFGTEKFRSARMAIQEGYSENRVFLDKDDSGKTDDAADDDTAELPFYIKLNDFRIEYYKPGTLSVVGAEGLIWRGKVEIEKEIDLGEEFGTVTVLQTFDNFQLREPGVAVDTGGEVFNPALQVLLRLPDGTENNMYVFQNYPDFSVVDDKFVLRYNRAVSEYISELEVIADGKVVAAKNIQVNDPLYYGGYHFYQTNYSSAGHQTYASVLSITSDSGLYVVYAGFILLCGGIIYHQWLRPFFAGRSKPAA